MISKLFETILHAKEHN